VKYTYDNRINRSRAYKKSDYWLIRRGDSWARSRTLFMVKQPRGSPNIARHLAAPDIILLDPMMQWATCQ
jgi:hypothetical protein